MDDIRAWFNGKRDYKQGIALYLKYGDGALKRLFTCEGYSDFKAKRLYESLDNILSALKQKNPAKTISGIKAPTSGGIKEVITVPVDNFHFTFSEKRWHEQGEQDDIERSLYLQWREAYQEMLNLQARVGDVARQGVNDPNKEQEAGRMALRILDLDALCDELYKKRDFYFEHKRLPEEEKPVEISLDPAQWHKRLESHKRFVRRFRKKLTEDPANTDAAAYLKKHEWAVEQYKKLLHQN